MRNRNVHYPYQQEYYPNEYYQQMHHHSAYQYPYMQQENPFQVQQQPLAFYPPNRPQSQPLGGMGPTYPYPTQKQAKAKKSVQPNIMSQFKASDGNYDINKMLNTAGTMVNTMNQITGMVKQVGGFFIPK